MGLVVEVIIVISCHIILALLVMITFFFSNQTLGDGTPDFVTQKPGPPNGPQVPRLCLESFDAIDVASDGYTYVYKGRTMIMHRYCDRESCENVCFILSHFVTPSKNSGVTTAQSRVQTT